MTREVRPSSRFCAALSFEIYLWPKSVLRKRVGLVNENDAKLALVQRLIFPLHCLSKQSW
jgi:hypothetical protein